jgi:hypothetical protein
MVEMKGVTTTFSVFGTIREQCPKLIIQVSRA